KGNKLPFFSFGTIVFIDMGENRGMRSYLRRGFKLQLLGKHPSKSAGINYKPRANLRNFTLLISDLDHGIFSFKIYMKHFRFKPNINSLPHGFFSKDHIKIGSGNLPGPVPAFPVFLTKIKFANLVSFDKSSAKFLLEPGSHHCI